MSAPGDNLKPTSSQKISEAEILEAATDVPLQYLPADSRPLSNNWYWRLIDKIGMPALWLACALVVFVIAATTFGGSAWEWTVNLFMLVLLLLVVWILGYVRASRRQNQLQATLKQAEYERRRAELARTIIEQAKKDQN